MGCNQLTSTQTTRIVIVDDHPLVREGLRSRLTAFPDFEICGEAETVRDGLRCIRESQPDVAIIDISLKDSHGLDLVRDIATSMPQVRILVVTAFDEAVYGERSLRAGALGYVQKTDAPEQIVDAVRTVRQNKRFISPSMTERLVNSAVSGVSPVTTDPVSRLSDRELEVFRLIGSGLTTGNIARRLFLSAHTIDTHREKIRHKLGIKDGHELMRQAIQWTLENA